MERFITSWTKEWRDLRLHKTREIIPGVNVILEKKSEVHLTVILDGLHEVPPIYKYASETNTVLIYANTPEDYNGTEEDKKKKIDEIIAEAERVYNGVTKDQIIDLQNTIFEYNATSTKIYSILNQMRDMFVSNTNK